VGVGFTKKKKRDSQTSISISDTKADILRGASRMHLLEKKVKIHPHIQMALAPETGERPGRGKKKKGLYWGLHGFKSNLEKPPFGGT